MDRVVLDWMEKQVIIKMIGLIRRLEGRIVQESNCEVMPLPKEPLDHRTKGICQVPYR
jgi:hypothetical protein